MKSYQPAASKCFLGIMGLIVSFLAAAQTFQATTSADTNKLNKIAAAFPLIEKLFKDHASKNNYPGVTYGLVVNGQLVHTGAFGYANLEKKIPMTTSSVSRIASMTKSFTAMAILQLRDAGKLNLDDPVSKYIPELATIKYLTTDAPPITIRHLLIHATGLPEDNAWGDRQLADTDEELIKLFTDGATFSSTPGVQYEYSNVGFALAGLVISRVSGKPYQQYMSENIFKPLGMNNTFWEFANVPESKLVQGYRRVNNSWQREKLLHDGAYGAMGGLLTSIEDFSKYMSLHLSAWPPRNEPESKVLRRSSIREMHFPWNFNNLSIRYKFPNGRECAIAGAYGYGLGWIIDCRGRTWVGHGGGLPGFGTQWRILPDFGIGVVSFANGTYAGMGGINMQVLDTLISIAQLKPRELPASLILESRKEQLVKLLPDWKNAERSNIFAENFFMDNSIDSLRAQSTRLFQSAGKIIRVSRMSPYNNLRGTFIIEGEKKSIEVFFTLTPENPPKIQAFEMSGQ